MSNTLQRWCMIIALALLCKAGAFAQVAGGTYTIGTEYGTIAAAITAINGGVLGAVTINVPAGYTETFSSGTAGLISITTNAPTATNTVKFQKSGSGTNPLITAGTGTATSDYIIKINGVSYITFDGIDLQENSGNTTANAKMEYGYYVVNATTTPSTNNTIQNCTVVLDRTNTNNTIGVYQSSGTATTLNSNNTYNNITVQNASSGIQLKGNSTGTSSDVGCVIKYCTIGANSADNMGGSNAGEIDGIYCTNQNNLQVFNCEVRNVTDSYSTSGTNLYGISTKAVTGTTWIYNNKVHNILNKDLAVASAYSSAFYLQNQGATDVINLYNNFVYAISEGDGNGGGTQTSTRLMCVYANGVGILNVYFNSMFLTNSSSTYYVQNSVLYFTGSPNSVNVKNNILKNTYANSSKSYCVYYNSGTVSASDYNNYDCSATGVVFTAGTGSSFTPASTDYSTLANLQAATGAGFTSTMDAHSKQYTSTDFISITAGLENLHLSPGGVNTIYIGTPISGITTDIDGETRNATYPYIGADEVIAYPLPVELTSFTGSANGRNVELVWKTATEINNSGFEIQRTPSLAIPLSGGGWTKIGFVDGAGTSSVAHSYSYADVTSAAATYSYRLKQIDRDGKFTYSNTVEVTTTLSAEDYKLSQNYPNPFNPSTKFSFAAKNAEHTTLKVYNIVGQEVATLFNAIAQPGQVYSLTFDAKNLPSGMYFYVLHSQSRNEIKKMMLMK